MNAGFRAFFTFWTPCNTRLRIIIPDIKLNLNNKQCVYYIINV